MFGKSHKPHDEDKSLTFTPINLEEEQEGEDDE
jgi:hypothetical protein